MNRLQNLRYAILFVSRLTQKCFSRKFLHVFEDVWSLHICFCIDSFRLFGWIMHANVRDVFCATRYTSRDKFQSAVGSRHAWPEWKHHHRSSSSVLILALAIGFSFVRQIITGVTDWIRFWPDPFGDGLVLPEGYWYGFLRQLFHDVKFGLQTTKTDESKQGS